MTQARNEPCACGSGKRFKNCHGQLASDGPWDIADRVDFVVAGTQKGGTTALDLYLRQHPGVSMAPKLKELHFFDNEMHFRAEHPGCVAYHANFAPRMPGQLRGETTPIYMYWEPAPARMASYNPALKIIVVLRNPITRAYSNWNMERQNNNETLPFLEALKAEPERLKAAQPLQSRIYSYADRGFYTRQLQRLWRHFPVEQTLILRTESLRTELDATLARIADFLQLAPFPRVEPRTAYVLPYERPIALDEWEWLAALYVTEIGELERLLGWDCVKWTRRPE